MLRGRHTSTRFAFVLCAAFAVACHEAAPEDEVPVDDPFGEDPGGVTFAGAPCNETTVCSGNVAARQLCYAVSTETGSRWEAAQTFDVSSTGPVSFVRLVARRPFTTPVEPTNLLHVELYQLTNGPTDIAGGTLLASGTKPVNLIDGTNSAHEIVLTPRVVLSPGNGTAPKYALLVRMSGPSASIALGCTDPGDSYAGGTALSRRRLRTGPGPNAFGTPAFAPKLRDLSFSLGLACDAAGRTGDCNLQSADACEVNLQTDDLNCGACGMPCSGANVVNSACTAAACTGTCAAGTGDCNTDLRFDGCETNTLSDAKHCGACGNVCGAGLNAAKSACVNGTCVSVECLYGQADCNRDGADGCEVNVRSSAANCGACGAACSTNGVVPDCANASCEAATCASGKADCNANKRADGCETDTTADPVNCGGCDVRCSTNHLPFPGCTAGACTGTCATGYGDCNTDKATDGCEIDLTSNVNHCGACNHACTAGAHANGVTCAASACRVTTCAAGWTDFDGDASNGCECQDGFIDLDGNPANGCEAPDTLSGATCATASKRGPLATGGTTSASGSIPNGSTSAWYYVDFPQNATHQQRGTGAPSITFTTNPSDSLRLELHPGSCAAPAISGGGGPEFTAYSFVDDLIDGEYGAGTANPCVGAQCTATVVSTACNFTRAGFSWAAVVDPATCGCDYQGISEATRPGEPTERFILADQRACNFRGNGRGGTGSYTTRDVAWPTRLYVRVFRGTGQPADTGNFKLQFAR